METSTGLITVIPDHLPDVDASGLQTLYFGVPLIEHSIRFARSCREVRRTLVAGKGPQATIPLEGTSFPAFDMLRDATLASEKADGDRVRFILLLNPLFPHRDPTLLMECFQRLMIDGWASGIIGVERVSEGTDLVHEEGRYLKKGSGDPSLRINGAFFLWRRDFVEEATENWIEQGRHQAYVMDPVSSKKIDQNVSITEQESWAKERKWRPLDPGGSYI